MRTCLKLTPSRVVPTHREVKPNQQQQGLEKQKGPELPVVQFTYAPADPETVVVVLSHTLSTVLAVLGSVWLLLTTEFTEPLFWFV